MTRFTASSFPGMGLEERITVSPGLMAILACPSKARRWRTDMGWPWLPVARMRTWWSGRSFTSSRV